MADANDSEQKTSPPLRRREADLLWHAPAEGLSGTLILVLFLDAVFVVVLLMSKLILLAFAVVGTLVLLVIFGLLSAAHLIGPGGITIQRPFSTKAQPWSAFAGWRQHGPNIELVYVDFTDERPLVVHPGQRPDEVIKWLDYYLDELPEEIISADG